VPPLDDASHPLFLYELLIFCEVNVDPIRVRAIFGRRMSGVVEDRANATMAFMSALGWKTLYFISSDISAAVVTQGKHPWLQCQLNVQSCSSFVSGVYQSIAPAMGIRMYAVTHKTSVGVAANSAGFQSECVLRLVMVCYFVSLAITTVSMQT
jgi:hypothetical protein